MQTSNIKLQTSNLAKLLGKGEEEVAAVVTKLEALCGHPSEDVRLLAENKQKIKIKISQLGLDPDDTNDEEMYYALKSRFASDSQTIDRAVGVDKNSTFDDRLEKAIQLVNHAAAADEHWSVKKPQARAALAEYRPKQVSKHLRYRSIRSLLKREDLSEIYLAGAVIEPATWQRNITSHLTKLSAKNYELRPITIVNLPSEKWQHHRGPKEHTVSNEFLGAVGVWPARGLKEVSVLNLVLMLLTGIQNLGPAGYKEALHELNPVLLWWADNSYLLSDGERPISFNVRDVAFNHTKGHDIHAAVHHHGGQSLWQELLERYQRISAAVTDVIEPPNKNNGKELAAELATLE